MTRIEATGIVDDNGTMTIPVPSDVSPGEHHVVIVVDDVCNDAVLKPDEESLDRRGTRLVFTGILEADPEMVRRNISDERQVQFVDDASR